MLVIIFDVLLLAVNYRTAIELKATSININLAGRQRMLSQKITKSALLIAYYATNENVADSNKDELRKATTLFERTLIAFREGGYTTDASGKAIYIDKLTSTTTSTILTRVNAVWYPVYNQIEDLLTSNTISEYKLRALIDALATQDSTLLDLMNALTVNLENDAKNKTVFLRSLQALVVLLIILSFGIATFRLYRKEHYYNDLMDKTSDIVISVDLKTALTTFVSNSVSEMLGHDEQYYLAKPVSLFFSARSKSIFTDTIKNASKMQRFELERCDVELLKSNGDIIIAELVKQITLCENGKDRELTATMRDITERKAAESALSELAHKDTLTGLPNRALFFKLAEHSLSLAKRHQTGFAIMFIDLDEFKAVNDNFGHDIGDAVLIEVANRIAHCLRASDSVSRIGGDEFIVLLDGEISKDDIANIAKKIITTISETIVINDCICDLGVSIGISRYPHDGVEVEQLMKKADAIMYAVKGSGKNHFLFCE